MKKALVFTAILVADCSSGGAIEHDVAPAQYVASPFCPLKSPSDWQRFLETTVADETWVRTCSDLGNCQELLGAFASHVRTDVLDVLDLCTSDLAANPAIGSCTARLRRFVPAWMQQHGSDSYGFRQDNHSYLASQSGPDQPTDMMNPPAELLGALPDRVRIEEAARANGWPYLTHDSGLGGVRTFINVLDAENRFEQWMVVGLEDNTRVSNPAIMSFIAVQKKDGGGRELPRVRMHFRDYLVTQAEGSWKLELPESYNGKCYACHASGMRLLIPTRESIAESAPVKGEEGYGQPTVATDCGLRRLVAFNQRLLSYGVPDWNGTLEPGDHGPPLGKGLGCTLCHDGSFRGVLTVSFSEGMLWQKVVGQLSMRSPRDGKSVPDQRSMSLLEREKTGVPPLSTDEASELDQARADHLADYDAIVQDRFSSWRAWVLEQPCD